MLETVKEMYARADRINAIKAMKKAERTEEQTADLKQWNKEAVRNTAALYLGIASATGTYYAIKNLAKRN